MFCSVHEEITSIRLCTPCNPRSNGTHWERRLFSDSVRTKMYSTF